MMLNYGLSMTSALGELKECLKEGSLDKVYLRLLDGFIGFALKNNFELIEIGSMSPFDVDALLGIKNEIKERIDGFEVSFHLPPWEVNIGALNHGVRESSVAEIKKIIDIVAELEIKKVSMHPGDYSSWPNFRTLFGDLTRSAIGGSIADIFKHCKEKEIELSLENLAFGQVFFQRPEDFAPFVEQGVGILVDTAHAATSGIDPVEFLKKFNQSVSGVHLVDGFKDKEDGHYVIGTGEVDFVDFIDELKRRDFKGPAILELYSYEDTLESLEALEQMGCID